MAEPAFPLIEQALQQADKEHQYAVSTLSELQGQLLANRNKIASLIEELEASQRRAEEYASTIPKVERVKSRTDQKLRQLRLHAEKVQKELAAERRMQDYLEELQNDDEECERKLKNYVSEVLRRDAEGYESSDSESEWSVLEGSVHSLKSLSRSAEGLPTRETREQVEYTHDPPEGPVESASQDTAQQILDATASPRSLSPPPGTMSHSGFPEDSEQARARSTSPAQESHEGGNNRSLAAPEHSLISFGNSTPVEPEGQTPRQAHSTLQNERYEEPQGVPIDGPEPAEEYTDEEHADMDPEPAVRVAHHPEGLTASPSPPPSPQYQSPITPDLESTPLIHSTPEPMYHVASPSPHALPLPFVPQLPTPSSPPRHRRPHVIYPPQAMHSQSIPGPQPLPLPQSAPDASLLSRTAYLWSQAQPATLPTHVFPSSRPTSISPPPRPRPVAAMSPSEVIGRRGEHFKDTESWDHYKAKQTAAMASIQATHSSATPLPLHHHRMPSRQVPIDGEA